MGNGGHIKAVVFQGTESRFIASKHIKLISLVLGNRSHLQALQIPAETNDQIPMWTNSDLILPCVPTYRYSSIYR